MVAASHPVHAAPSQGRQSSPPGHDDPWPALVAASLSVDPQTLRRFTEAMADRGEAVDVARLFLDTVYAYRRLATAHAGSDEGLKALSLTLFDRYQDLEHRRRRSDTGLSAAH